MNLGKAFSDSVVIESRSRKSALPDPERAWWLGSGKALFFSVLFFVAFFILFLRLFNLTVVNGHEYRSLADGNRIRELVAHAPRGNFLDRTGKPLTANESLFRLINPCELADTTKSQTACVRYISPQEGERLLREGVKEGTFLEEDYERRYLYGSAVAHVLGYTGEIAHQELQDEYFILRRYIAGDRLGRSGAEAVYEERLRGRDGRELVEVDATGKISRVLGRDPEVPGSDVHLSLDAQLSEVVRDAFPKNARGAVVVSKPDTGEILALFSSPSFDPAIFSKSNTDGAYERVLNHPDRPLFDRAIGGVYPPGSTFKLVTALAALEEGTITATTRIEDTGVVIIGPFSFANWYFTRYGKTEGLVDVVKGIARSNDVFFYKVGESLGIDALASWARRMGVGRPTGIELPGEASGLMPDPTWKARRFATAFDREARNDQWYTGDTYHVAIGQGYLLTTPLQVNVWANVVANGGTLCRPTIEKRSQEVGVKNPGCRDLDIQKETIELITSGMTKACEPGGTAWPLFDFSIRRENQNDSEATSSATRSRVPVACKTGTAEFGDAGKTHAWFTVFGPLPSKDTPGESSEGRNSKGMIAGIPEISITVLVEEAGEGSEIAAPIARTILEAWFSR